MNCEGEDMNQEELFLLLNQAGITRSWETKVASVTVEQFERFAALVAAKAVLDERDALCDIVDAELDSSGHALAIKLAVRARG